jgi:hypothetical protein
MAQTEFKRGDRVKRRDVAGPLGTVQNIRIESIRSSLKHDSSGEGPGVNVTVLWDNGTLSHFIPDGLERV